MLKVNKKLLEEIEVYCKINEIGDPDKFLNDLIGNAFSVLKYGNKPDIEIKPKQIAKEEPGEEIPQPEIKQEDNTIIVTNKRIENDNYNDIYDI